MILFLCVVMTSTLNSSLRPPALQPFDLRTEYTANPLGIDVPHPRLSWKLKSDQRAQVQTAYQVIAASSAAKLRKPDLWDSGKVASAKQIGIAYAGKRLVSGQRVYWKVRVWDRQGASSDFSPTAWWETGLLTGEWRAQWINSGKSVPQRDEEFYEDRPAPLFRKEFTATKKVRRARLYVSGLGYYECRLNGQRVGDHVLDPAWTDYSKRVFYSTYDVTRQIAQGRNALGMMLGSGWYDPLPLRLFGRWNLREELPIGRPKLIAQLRIEYADGTQETMGTDTTWKVGDGPILRNSVYLGEVYDARREQPGWDQPGFDDHAWRPAHLSTDKSSALEAQPLPPIRATRTVKSVKITQPKPGVYIIDLGQNFAGWVTLRTRGPAGTRVVIRYGELLHPDGTLNILTSCTTQIKAGRARGGPGAPATAWQSETYILSGRGDEEYTPRFTFHGFRYVELTGLAEPPTLKTVTGHALNSDVESVGTFSCSNPMFNRIQEMVRWTHLSNMFSVQSDCPHREKLGYGGDIVASSEMAMLNFDMSRFYAKALQDFADAVRSNGGFTETAPFVGIADEGLGEKSGPIGWGTAYPLLQWQLYQYYGDRRALGEYYEGTKRWIALLQSRAVDGTLDNGISDHESLVPKPRALTGTAFYYFNVALAARMARVLGHADDARRYELLANEIRDAFNRRFLKPGGMYDSGTQACQAFALYFGLVPDKDRASVLDVLVRDILDTHKGHLTAGIFGVKYMLNALSDVGRADVAYTMADQKDFPGWGYMLANGATTLWEHWALSEDVYSHNHPMFGSVSEWFFKTVGGIAPADDAVGFDKVVIRPQPVKDLTWAKCRYASVRGDIVCDWRVEGKALRIDVTIPPNTTAIVHVPTATSESVTESGVPVGRADGLRLLRQDRVTTVLEIGSGSYRFASLR